MIQLSIFMTEMSLLADRFNRPPSMPVLERYYEILNTELTEAQFLAAARQSFTEDDFFPSPKRLIELGTTGEMSVSKQIGKLMRQLGIKAVLPPEWQHKTGCQLAQEMTPEQQEDYLRYLQQISSRLIEAGDAN